VASKFIFEWDNLWPIVKQHISIARNDFKSYISALKISKMPICLFGASIGGVRILNILRHYGVNVAHFCDNDIKKHGKQIEGITCIPPNELSGKEVVIISSFAVLQIKEQLGNLGLTNIVDFTYIENYWDDILTSNGEILKKMWDMFNDEESKLIITKRLLAGGYISLADFSDIQYNGPQYFCKEIITPIDDEVYVDVGAYDGDTIKEFLAFSDKYSQIVAYEPEPNNYKKLIANVEKLNRKNIICKNLGLSDSSRRVNLMGKGTLAAIVELNDFTDSEKSNVVRLDDDRSEPVTFIKMDIQGEELKALKGAENIIKKSNPVLSVCIYHLGADLWTIPLYLKKLLPNHSFFIKHYSKTHEETLCYAVPYERLCR
jgi:FkbM family methyltransferase